MPFGRYRDFDDCVSKNQDKEDPEAYCAEIERRAEEESSGAPRPKGKPEWIHDRARRRRR